MPVSTSATVTPLPVQPRDQAACTPLSLSSENIEPRSRAAFQPSWCLLASLPSLVESSPHSVDSIVLPRTVTFTFDAAAAVGVLAGHTASEAATAVAAAAAHLVLRLDICFPPGMHVRLEDQHRPSGE